MAAFRNATYFTLGYVDGEAIKNDRNTTLGFVENGKVTDRDHHTIGYVVGNTLVNSRDSVIAKFDEGDIYDGHGHIIGHYDGGEHIGAGGAAYLVLLPSHAA